MLTDTGSYKGGNVCCDCYPPRYPQYNPYYDHSPLFSLLSPPILHRFENEKDSEDYRAQQDTNFALEKDEDLGEDERILEGTGRENIWDKIQVCIFI